MSLIPPYGVVIVDEVVVATDVMPIATVPVEPKTKEVLFEEYMTIVENEFSESI